MAKFPTVEIGGVPLRIYRTGDIGMLDDAGILDFRGRRDRQGENQRLPDRTGRDRSHRPPRAGIRDCAVIPVTAPDGQVTRLALFYLTEPGSVNDAEDDSDPLSVQHQLTRLLPGYLVPGSVAGWCGSR